MRATRVTLDTTAYVHLRRGHPDVTDAVARAELVHLPGIVLGELEAGFILGRRTAENRTMLSEFLDEPFVSVIPVDQQVARVYGQLFSDLRRAGTPIPVNDIWIAAATIAVGAHLLTFDRDFAKLERLAHTCFDG
jgi:tRNA(fMet)-specific endonuclease VapC